MTDMVHNIAKGRVVEFHNRVDQNDPTNAALIMIVWNATGATDDNIRDADDVAALEAVTNVAEVTNTNYTRATFVDTDLATITPDDTNNRFDVDIPDNTWSSVAAGSAWTNLGINYDSDTTAGTDANIVPCTWHDFAVTPDGSDITAQIDAAGYFRAT